MGEAEHGRRGGGAAAASARKRGPAAAAPSVSSADEQPSQGEHSSDAAAPEAAQRGGAPDTGDGEGGAVQDAAIGEIPDAQAAQEPASLAVLPEAAVASAKQRRKLGRNRALRTSVDPFNMPLPTADAAPLASQARSRVQRFK